MGKKLISVVACLTLIGAFYCGGKKEEPKPAERAADSPQDVANNMNNQLSNHMLIGFPAWGGRVSSAELDAWAQQSKPVVEEIVKTMPEGYHLMIAGHASSGGPAARNQTVSKARAKFVWEALSNAGMDMSKVQFKGYGSSFPLNAGDPGHESNRRVSFVVEPN